MKCRIRSCRILFNGFRSEENTNFTHTNYTQWMYVAVKVTEPTKTRSRLIIYLISKPEVYSSMNKNNFCPFSKIIQTQKTHLSKDSTRQNIFVHFILIQPLNAPKYLLKEKSNCILGLYEKELKSQLLFINVTVRIIRCICIIFWPTNHF